MAETTDLVEDTICYQKIVTLLTSYLDGSEFKTIEYLVASCLESLKKYFIENKYTAEIMTFCVLKCFPPVPEIDEGVSYWIGEPF